MAASPLPRIVVQRLLGIAERRGLDPALLLRRTGIRPDAVHGGTPPSIDQAAELTQELWILTGDELFGLGPPAPLGLFQLVMRSAIHVPDLGEGLERLAGAGQILPAMPPLSVGIDGGLCRVEIDASRLDDPDHFVTELLLTLIHRVLGWLAGRRIPLRAVELPWPTPDYAAQYEIVFGVTPAFATARLAFAFDAALLSTPVVRDEQELTDYLRDQPRVWFATRDYGVTVADHIRRILEQGLRGHWPTSDEIAARLNVSTQHLRRLLRQHGTSIGQIKQEILRDAAIASLRRGDESVESLATRLGFSEASAFRRAFRRWTGHPPAEFRALARATPPPNPAVTADPPPGPADPPADVATQPAGPAAPGADIAAAPADPRRPTGPTADPPAERAGCAAPPTNRAAARQPR
ncbi:AraC family transcriptional regulator ligand-binding domain-containing protein [Dactylosporangium sp. CA-092794]|uniref:AraC family transcriptional regulator n=1 Tax=Dactylosporangium sp. CA-092794 TaxID=3239929 RepID=UPI003D8AC157